MFNKKVLCQALAVAGLVATAGAANASISVFTSASSFMAAMEGAAQAPGVDTYTDLAFNIQVFGPLNREAGAFGYRVDTAQLLGNPPSPPGGALFGGGTFSNPAMSTNVSFDTMLFNNFVGGIAAVGGNFYTADINGGAIPGSLTLLATDATGASITRTITGTNATGFLGFISTAGFMASLQVTSVQPLAGGFAWPTADNLMLANVTPIPEPGTYALMLAGLVGVGSMVARARRKG